MLKKFLDLSRFHGFVFPVSDNPDRFYRYDCCLPADETRDSVSRSLVFLLIQSPDQFCRYTAVKGISVRAAVNHCTGCDDTAFPDRRVP